MKYSPYYPTTEKIKLKRFICVTIVIILTGLIWTAYELNRNKNAKNQKNEKIIPKSPITNHTRARYNWKKLVGSISKIESAKKCYQSQIDKSNIDFLPDILEADVKPVPGQSIFFHVTSCSNSSRIELSAV